MGMNWKKWLGKQVRRGAGRWAGRAVGMLRGCGKGGGCAATEGSECPAPSNGSGDSAGKSGGSWIERFLMQGAKRMGTQNGQAARLLDEVMARLDAVLQGGGGSGQGGGEATGGAGSGDARSGGAGSGGAAPGEARPGGAMAGGAVAGGGLPDAIDREMAARPMQTVVARVRQSEVVEQFRRELETQSLTVTTVTSFLQLLQQVLPMLLVR